MGIPIVVQKARRKFRNNVRHRNTRIRPIYPFLLRRSILDLRISVSSSHMEIETPSGKDSFFPLIYFFTALAISSASSSPIRETRTEAALLPSNLE